MACTFLWSVRAKGVACGRQRKLVRKRELHGPTILIRTLLGHPHLSTAGDKSDHEVPKNRSWPTGTAVVNVMLVAKVQQPRINWVEQTNLMKTNTTRNVTSVVMLVILSPFLLLAMLVSIKTAGIRDNDVLLVLLTLSSAVLSGINGFGRRRSTTVSVNARGDNPSQARIPLSARSSNNA